VQELQAAADREAQIARQSQIARQGKSTRPRVDAAERQSRASNASSTYMSLERAAKRIFQSPGGSLAWPGGAGLASSVRSTGDVKELAEWRAFLELAPEGLRVSAEKAAEKRSEVASLEKKVRNIERAAVAGSGRGVEAAESRVAAAKLKVEGTPTAEAYLGSFRPSAVQQTHTDTNGVFSLAYPRGREFVLFARADGAARGGNSEKCYWLVNAPSGWGDLWLQLSNDNLAHADSEGRVHVLTTAPSKRPASGSAPEGASKDSGLRRGNVVVRAVGGRVAPVCWRDAAGRPQFTGPCLTLGVSVSNLSNSKIVSFETWRGAAALTDDSGNRYKQVNVTPASNLLDPDPDRVSIHPQQAHFDRVIFEIPVRDFKWLRLKLPGRNCGASGTLQFEIPASQVR